MKLRLCLARPLIAKDCGYSSRAQDGKNIS